MVSNPLWDLKEQGQSFWYDNISRGLITSGGLHKLRDEDGLVGITSNPTIFEKAISGSADYDDAIERLVVEDKGLKEIYTELTVSDIRSAADILRPIYDESQGRDGFVSLEVSPHLAHDTDGTIEAARVLTATLDRPNVMVKIPGTPEGLPAIERCISEGLNINITLLFDIENYVRVAWAYVSGLEKRMSEGKPVDRIGSVASFFVSRVDTAVDGQLAELISSTEDAADKARLMGLLGRAAISNAKIAYSRYKEIFASDRFRKLADRGAAVQRCLWASTSTKNPQYSDTIYADGLIGAETVNTMPQVTVDAFRDHGVVSPTLEEGLSEAESHLKELSDVGIDFRAVTNKLQADGVEAFAASYDKLLDCIREKKSTISLSVGRRCFSSLGALSSRVDERIADLAERRFTERLWDKDVSLWQGNGDGRSTIKGRLGWLNVAESMASEVGELTAFAHEIKEAAFKSVLVLGMGGSSLASEVFQRSFGESFGHPTLEVLDSTDPGAILAAEHSRDLAETLFIVSSKSGSTIETLALLDYFWHRIVALESEAAGANFVAITDPGTDLERMARARSFRRVYLGPPDVGGRYSALSHFGLVPAAVIGVDVGKLLDRVRGMVHDIHLLPSGEDNPGSWLGAVLGEMGMAGRDKVTFLNSPGLESFGVWAEQLLAESTGKDGRGLIPIEGEPVGSPSVYGDDRLIVHMNLDSSTDDIDQELKALREAGQPVLEMPLSDVYDLGREFFRWEVATAIAGALFQVNPFDEPNVAESKENTARLLGEFEAMGRLSEPRPISTDNGLSLFAEGDVAARLGSGSLTEQFKEYVTSVRRSDYIAIMAYFQPTSEGNRTLTRMRVKLRDALGIATTLGYGPRFLHSTGQVHKGGPNRGVFLQLTTDDHTDLPIPGRTYGFSVLKRAQALGDLQSLQSRELRVVRIHLGSDVIGGLENLEQLLELALI